MIGNSPMSFTTYMYINGSFAPWDWQGSWSQECLIWWSSLSGLGLLQSGSTTSWQDVDQCGLPTEDCLPAFDAYSNTQDPVLDFIRGLNYYSSLRVSLKSSLCELCNRFLLWIGNHTRAYLIKPNPAFFFGVVACPHFALSPRTYSPMCTRRQV